MAVYIQKADKRNTSNGMTPAKSISRPTNPPVKKNLGMQTKKMIRRPQGK